MSDPLPLEWDCASCVALHARIERLEAALQSLLDEVKCFSVDPPSAALNHAIETADSALADKEGQMRCAECGGWGEWLADDFSRMVPCHVCDKKRETEGHLLAALKTTDSSVVDYWITQALAALAVNISWSSEDEGYIAVDMTRPGCSAFGETKAEAMRELADAQAAWDEAKRMVSRCR